VDISPDGNRLATAAGSMESVKLWDMHTHQELITLAGDSAIMVTLRFSPDGNKIVGWNDRGRVQIWRAPSWAEIELAERGKKAGP
jgi:WD40 repeat protein